MFKPSKSSLQGSLDRGRRPRRPRQLMPLTQIAVLGSFLCLIFLLRLPVDDQGYRAFKPSSPGMDEPVLSWACFDSFDWLTLHMFLTLRLKNSIRQHFRMNARPLLPSKRCHSLRGTRECFETSPHLAYRNLPSMQETRLASLPLGHPNERAELGGTTQDRLPDQVNKSCFETRIWKHNAAWPS